MNSRLESLDVILWQQGAQGGFQSGDGEMRYFRNTVKQPQVRWTGGDAQRKAVQMIQKGKWEWRGGRKVLGGNLHERPDGQKKEDSESRALEGLSYPL